MTFTLAFYVDSVPFTPGELDGTKSLGGSESACLGLARALSARGHLVHIFATKLDPACVGMDTWGVRWHSAQSLVEVSRVIEWDVFCSLRMPAPFQAAIRARLRVLWNQDLMNQEAFKNAVMGVAWALDKSVYVSEFHRAQWEDWIPELKGIGWATKNGFDPAHVPTGTVKKPHQVIHISRPERGLLPLLTMWPALKAQVPDATLKLCRYNSMYDKDGWGQVCAAFDREVAQVNEEVGGIEFLGELGKADLYRAIAESAVMWYPGVDNFAETSCIAAIESQANGTPFVGSYKGALPETVPAGFLVSGDARTKEYQAVSVSAVADLLKGCANNSFQYRRLVGDGKRHVEAYTYAAIAGEWEAWLEQSFRERYESQKAGVLAQLLHFDDHTAARIVAQELGDPAALALCDQVIAGKMHQAGDYAEHAMDPHEEIDAPNNGRLRSVVRALEGCSHVLDVACGNGSFAIALAAAHPEMRVTAVDYSQGNIDVANAAAQDYGVSDRVTFICSPVWDFDQQQMSAWWDGFAADGRRFDGMFVGEFVEHVANPSLLIDRLEEACVMGARVIYTCPNGPLMEMCHRNKPYLQSHLHHFAADDIVNVWGPKQDRSFELLPWPDKSPAGSSCGQWFIGYAVSGAKAGYRDYPHRILTTRPRKTLSVGILALNAEHDIVKCIDSIWALADEIIVGDTGSKDRTRELVAHIPRVRVIDVQPVSEHPDGFAGARNDVLNAASGEWFFWIDTDEVLAGAHALPFYLESEVYQGFAVYQNHLQLDAPRHADSPVRIFRRRPDIQFYGCVHEQPQMGDCNGDIVPVLQIEDAQIAHMGYLVEGIRRNKMANRNFPLLLKDRERFPDRRLGKVLVLRDLVNLADYSAESHGGKYPPHAIEYLKRAIAMFEAEFADPSDKFHSHARPWYERALKTLRIGYEAEMAFLAKEGGLNGDRSKAQRVWVRDPQDFRRLIDWQADQMLKQFASQPVRVTPLTQPREAVAV